jgi:hypothetical protein
MGGTGLGCAGPGSPGAGGWAPDTPPSSSIGKTATLMTLKARRMRQHYHSPYPGENKMPKEAGVLPIAASLRAIPEGIDVSIQQHIGNFTTVS